MVHSAGRRVSSVCLRGRKENLDACQAHHRDAELPEGTDFFRWYLCTVSVGPVRGSLDVTRRASLLEGPALNDSGC